jgi:hypothetical protein
MKSFQAAEPLNIIPNGIKISDMTYLLENENSFTSSEMHWRRALLDMAVDTLPIIQQCGGTDQNAIWKDEARLRASRFLQLALVDARQPRHTGAPDCKWDHPSIAKLAHCYRALPQNNLRSNTGHVFKNVLSGLAAAYRPILPKFEFQHAITAMPLRAGQCRALALLMGCLLQGSFERAVNHGGSGQCLLSLNSIGRSEVRLTIDTLEPAAVVAMASGHDIVSRLAAALDAELVYTRASSSETSLELQFSITSQTYHKNFSLMDGCPNSHPFGAAAQAHPRRDTAR